MKKIYIVLTYTGTVLASIIKRYTRCEYSHVSIALDQNLDEMYSFGRLNAYNPFIGGLVHEGINRGTFKRFKNTSATIYSLDVTDKQYNDLKFIIQYMINTRKGYKFNYVGLFAVALNKKIRKKFSFYCAEFVKYVLLKANIDVDLPEIIKPEDFKEIENLDFRYKGKLRKYNKDVPCLYNNRILLGPKLILR